MLEDDEVFSGFAYFFFPLEDKVCYSPVLCFQLVQLFKSGEVLLFKSSSYLLVFCLLIGYVFFLFLFLLFQFL